MSILSKHPFFPTVLLSSPGMRAGFCLCPEQVLVMLGTSTPRGMQGFTSTPAHGVPLVGHCLFDPSLQAGGSRKHFNPTLPVWVTQTVLSHTQPLPIILPSWQARLPLLQSLPLELCMLPQGFFQVKLTKNNHFKNNK